MPDEKTSTDTTVAPPVDGPKGWARHLIVGFLMGSADVVPGVSGGTVAFVCGIYARLVDAIRDASRLGEHVVRGKIRDIPRAVKGLDFALVIPLLTGLFIAVLSLASVLEHQLETNPVQLAGLFFGLVAGSVVVSYGQIRRPDAKAVALIAVSAIIFFLLLGLKEDAVAHGPEVADAPLWAYPASAAIAICAMILPGISGSFILVLLGMYGDVLGAVNDRDLLPVVLFLLGCVLGLALFSRLLAWMLDRYHDAVVAVMVGLMLGSLRLLWPWPNGTASSVLAAPSDPVMVTVVLAVVGFLLVLVLGRFGALKEEPVPNPG